VANVFSVTGEDQSSTDAGNNVTGSSAVIAGQYLHNASGVASGALTVDGLVPGRQYLLSLYGVDPDASGSTRVAQFSDSQGHVLSIDEDAFGPGNGIVVNYEYTAGPSGTATITIAQTVVGTAFNWYGFANRELEGPAIQVVASGSGSITLSWPNSVTGYTLQSSPTLGAGASWQTVSGVQSQGGVYQVTVPTTGVRFYRLEQ
jgi:hypothetical protein